MADVVVGIGRGTIVRAPRWPGRDCPNATSACALRPDDHIAIIGGGLADRMQHDGWLETYLQAQFPEHRLTIRNLGFTGDEVDLRMRSEGFGTPQDWLRRVQATVVLAMFGYNESFAGQAGLSDFKSSLTRFVTETTKQSFSKFGAPTRLVLISSNAFENVPGQHLPDGVEINQRLSRYTDAMREVAEEQGVAFVDLFAATKSLYQHSDQPLTINGIHLNSVGNRQVGRLIVESLYGELPNSGVDLMAINEAVRDKNFHWFHRYRTTDGYSTFGGRKGLGGSAWTPINEDVLKRELEILDVMAANRDQQIWARAAGGDAKIDDANTPDFIPVASNKPGPLPDGDYPFLGAEEAIEKMTVATGMQINLFASEEQFPDLKNPVQLAVDTAGRLWVAVWPSYPHWTPKDPMDDKLLILEDTDGDGRADKCQTFAGGLHNPTGFELYQGGVYVAQVPDLWFIKDTDGDDIADERTRVLGGIDSADTHHSINSFVLDPGGGLYFQEGVFHRTQIETPYGPPTRVADGGVFRYRPRSQKVDVYSAYSFPNPHGHVFDYWGLDIVHDGTGAGPIFGPSFSGHVDYPQRHPSAPQVYQQRTRPCSGTAILSSAHFPEENRDTLLVCNVIGFQGILQYRLEPSGAGLLGTEIEPIVYSSDVNFRPSDIEIGADGAIYFSDWQNPLIGHMQHNLRDANRDHRHGRIYRVTHRESRPLQPLKIADQPIPQLLTLLEERDNGIRYRAKIELSDRASDQVIRATNQWMENLNADDAAYEHHLLEGLWVHQHHHVINEQLLRRLLTSDDYRVRAAAARVFRAWQPELNDAKSILLNLVHDKHPRVRLIGVLACSDLRSAEAAEVALVVAQSPRDKFLEYALKEAVATLAPYWKPALAAGQPFCEDNPDAIEYLLAEAGPEELAQLKPSEPVFVALLERPGIARKHRLRALVGLAQLRQTQPVLVLLEWLAKPTASSAGELSGTLAEWDLAELRDHETTIRSLVENSQSPQIRQGALAALARLGPNPREIWQAYVGNYRAELIASISLIPEAAVRAEFYDLVRPFALNASAVVEAHSSDNPVHFSYFENAEIDNVRLDAINSWTPLRVGHLPDFSNEIPDGRSDWFAVMQRASLQVPVKGNYTFYLTSDDGSRLYLDGQELIDNDGLHTSVTRQGTLELAAGPHELVVTYFNGPGSKSLDVAWEGPGKPRAKLTASDLAEPTNLVRTMAIEALAHVPGHDARKIADLTTVLLEGQLTWPTIIALQSIPASAWSPEDAQRVAQAVVEFVQNLPVARRTSRDIRQTMTFARDSVQPTASRPGDGLAGWPRCSAGDTTQSLHGTAANGLRQGATCCASGATDSTQLE